MLQQQSPVLLAIKQRWEIKHGKVDKAPKESEMLKARSPDQVTEEEL